MSSVVVENLEIRATGADLPIVSDISFSIEPGCVLGIVGESGSGKTTVAHAMLGYSRPGTKIASGSVRIDGIDILAGSPADRAKWRGRKVTYVPQDPSASLNPTMTLGEQLTERLVLGEGAISKDEALARVKGILGEVRLPSDDRFLAKYPKQISGGQQQRIGIAIAIASRPSLVVLDEPTTGLDVSTQRDVLKLVADLCASHRISAIYVSHDLAVIRHVAQDVLVLYAGRVVELAPADPFFALPRHPYSAALLASMPSLEARHALVSIPGHPPTLNERTGHCVFSDRCGYRQPTCDLEPPLTGQARQVRCHFPLDANVNSPNEHVETTAVAGDVPVVLSVDNLLARYGDKVVLHDIDLSLRRGACLSIVGESGSGKSTLSRCLIGLHPSFSGTLRIGDHVTPHRAGKRSRELRRKVQYVFQNPYGSLNPRRTVGAALMQSHIHYHRGVSRADRDASILATLDKVKLPAAYLDRFPGELSGGEKQRVAIARALIADPEVIICDEITSALDVSVQAAIIELLRELKDAGLALVFVTHNLGVVRSISDEVAVINQGYIVELGTTKNVLDAPSHFYTRELMKNTLSIAAE